MVSIFLPGELHVVAEEAYVRAAALRVEARHIAAVFHNLVGDKETRDEEEKNCEKVATFCTFIGV